MKRLIRDYARGQWILVDESKCIINPEVLGRYNTKREAEAAKNGSA